MSTGKLKIVQAALLCFALLFSGGWMGFWIVKSFLISTDSGINTLSALWQFAFVIYFIKQARGLWKEAGE